MNTPSLFTRLFRMAVLPLGAAWCCVSPVQAVSLSAAREWNEQLLAAIRLNLPNPPAHARNLHHVATAMYDAFGFVAEGRRTNYYRGSDGRLFDAVTMVLDLKHE